MDMLKLVRRIPSGLPVPDLKHKLVKIMADLQLQVTGAIAPTGTRCVVALVTRRRRRLACRSTTNLRPPALLVPRSTEIRAARLQHDPEERLRVAAGPALPPTEARSQGQPN